MRLGHVFERLYDRLARTDDEPVILSDLRAVMYEKDESGRNIFLKDNEGNVYRVTISPAKKIDPDDHYDRNVDQDRSPYRERPDRCPHSFESEN